MNFDYGQANLSLSCALVDQLAACGVAHAIVCPGSRSTPLAIALSAHPSIRIWVLVDERSAAFFALGMARQLAAPVALLCTSGTAAANFLPAVAEARLSRIPLVVLTADRPPELRDWGAAQTIDQAGLYGSHALWAVDLPVPDGDLGLGRHVRAVARRAVETAIGPPSGPVHLNLPFREPLLPACHASTFDVEQRFAEGRDARATFTAPQQSSLPEQAIAQVAGVIARNPRGIIVCGPDAAFGAPVASDAAALSDASGYPILADPLSCVRFGPHDRANVIDSYDAFVRDLWAVAQLAPDVVIRLGAIPTSKPLQQFLNAHAGAHHILVDAGEARDPSHLAVGHLHADPAAALAGIAAARKARGNHADKDWQKRWVALDRMSREAIADALATSDELSEARAVAELVHLVPERATIMVGNSMPVRDFDTFVRGDCRRLRIVGNRGANGIDGVVSSALGAAAVAEDPVVLILGDLSYYHDLNGLLAARRFGLRATIVVLNNDGGGIFSFLPQADQLDRATFESLFGTPIGLDIAQTARLFGARHERPSNWPAFRDATSRSLAHDGLSIVEVATDRNRNVAQHRAIAARVAEAVAAWGEGAR